MGMGMGLELGLGLGIWFAVGVGVDFTKRGFDLELRFGEVAGCSRRSRSQLQVVQLIEYKGRIRKFPQTILIECLLNAYNIRFWIEISKRELFIIK